MEIKKVAVVGGGDAAEEEALFVGVANGEGSPLARLERLAAAIPALFGEWAMVGRLLLELRRTRLAPEIKPGGSEAQHGRESSPCGWPEDWPARSRW